MAYLRKKGAPCPGPRPDKPESEKFLTSEQMDAMLAACEKERDSFNLKWKRDYALLYLMYSLGLRVGETVLLERRHFRDVEALEKVYLPTLKRWPRVPYLCEGCKKRCKVRAERIGQTFNCPRRNKPNEVKRPSYHIPAVHEIPEIDVPMIEGPMVGFVLDYMKRYMRDDQQYLFETAEGRHMSTRMAQRIFDTYAQKAGLGIRYSAHAERHVRGQRLYKYSNNNLTLVAQGLRHRGTRTVERYVHLDQEQLDGYKKKMDRTAIDPLKRKGASNG